MLIEYAPTDPDLISILNKSTTYINKEGEHPEINTGIHWSKLKNTSDKLTLMDDEWTFFIDNQILSDKMKSQIVAMKFYKNSIFITS